MALSVGFATMIGCGGEGNVVVPVMEPGHKSRFDREREDEEKNAKKKKKSGSSK